jgi:hypothetical protein
MRCPKCGGIVNHIITDTQGHNFYECGTGLTRFKKDGTRCSEIYPCNTTLDSKGKVFTGFVLFRSDGKLRTVSLPIKN